MSDTGRKSFRRPASATRRRFSLRGAALLLSKRKTDPPAPATNGRTSLHQNKQVELGSVPWLRSLDVAEHRSKETGKPIFLLFQEVPGCQTCTSFGKQVLANPLLAEGIATLFTPCLVNNRATSTADRAALLRFGEPQLNNPVVRFVYPKQAGTFTDLIPRKDALYSPVQIAQRMVRALDVAARVNAMSKPAPQWLIFAEQQLSLIAKAKVETAVFYMSCYWVGEAALGALALPPERDDQKRAPILQTKAAWHGGSEVVQVDFDSSSMSYRELLRLAHQLDEKLVQGVVPQNLCQKADALEIFGRRVLTDKALESHRNSGLVSRKKSASAFDQKHDLCQFRKKLPPLGQATVDALTEQQKIQLNALLGNRRKLDQASTEFLSPIQRRGLRV